MSAPPIFASQMWVSKNRNWALEQWEAEVRNIVAAGASVLPERWDSLRALGSAMLDFASKGTAASYRALERAARQCITDWGRRVARHAVNSLRQVLLQQSALHHGMGIDASAWEASVEYWYEWWLMSLQSPSGTEGWRVESFLSEIGELLERWQRAPAFPHDPHALWRDIVAPGIVEEMRADACSIYYWDRRRHALNLVVTYGWQAGRWSHNQLSPDAHIAEQAALRKELIRVRAGSYKPKAHAHLTPPEGFQMSLHIPLWFGDQLIGILGLMFREPKRRIPRRRRDVIAAKVAFLLKMLEAMCVGAAPQMGMIPIEDMQMLTNAVRLSEVYQQQMEHIQSIFLALVSHELRTPLTPILVYARLLEAEQLGPLTEEQREAMEVIREQTRRLVRMVDNTLDLCAIHAGMPPKLQFSRQPLNELLAMAIQEVTPAAMRRKIQLRAAEGAKLTLVRGDARCLLRALINVLDSLVKITPEGGKLHVQTHQDAKRNEIRIFAEGAILTQDEVTKIFDPFYQLDSRLAREHGGIGLGLAVAQHIIESHDGCVKVEALPGRGCVCTITLPALHDSNTV